MVDKRQVLAALLAQVEDEVAVARKTAATTRAGMTHAENRQENDKDTRAIEASYLARGQALRVEELAEVATRLRVLQLTAYGPDDPIGLGALVEVALDDDAAQRWYFLVPAGGGRSVCVGGVTVQAVSAAAPIGRALVGGVVGDDVTVRLGGGPKTLTIAGTS